MFLLFRDVSICFASFYGRALIMVYGMIEDVNNWFGSLLWPFHQCSIHSVV